MDDTKAEGLPVLGMLPGSTAHDAGIRVGDIILAIDDYPIRSVEEYAEHLKLPCTYLVKRGSQVLEFTVTQSMRGKT